MTRYRVVRSELPYMKTQHYDTPNLWVSRREDACTYSHERAAEIIYDAYLNNGVPGHYAYWMEEAE